MDDARMIELLVALHDGLPRQGPGTRAATLRALAMCAHLPPRPALLDVGCGSGAATLDLARATLGPVTGVDLMPTFVDALRARAAAEGLGDRVVAAVADMNDLPFADASFDAVWSEGAIYQMGFDHGLAAWRRLVRPGGYVVVSELSWLTDARPAEIAAWWAAEYPAMRSADENAAAAAGLGYEVVGRLTLPRVGWTEDYYGPLAARLGPFLAARPGDADAAAVVEATRREMDLYDRFGDVYGYVFYALRTA
jgi:SAM-dependent methyltransferase